MWFAVVQTVKLGIYRMIFELKNMEVGKERNIEKLKILFHKVARKEQLDTDEQKLLNDLLGQAEWERVHQQLSDGDYLYGRLEDFEQYSKRDAFKKFSKQVYPSSRKKRFMWGISVAASVLILLGLSLLLINRSEREVCVPVIVESIIPAGKSQATLVLSDGKTIFISDTTKQIEVTGMAQVQRQKGGLVYHTFDDSLKNEVMYNELIVPRGGEFNLTLEDGTKVRLNADSRLRYPVKFVGKERRVEVEGEAFFEVMRNEHMPFVVVCSGIKMKVLGTSFNVNSYTDEPVIRATLITGKLEVSVADKKVVLLPGVQSQVNVKTLEMKTEEVNTRMYTAWMDNKFSFKNKALNLILADLSRWYDVEFICKGIDAEEYYLTGRIPRHCTLQEVVVLLEKISRLKFQIEGRKVFVR